MGILSVVQLKKRISDYIEVEVKGDFKKYKRLALFDRVAVAVFKTLVILPAIATSALAAIEDPNQSTIRFCLVALPLMSSAAGVILVKFKLSDMWKLRERGRSAAKLLYDSARRLLDIAETREDLETLYEDIVNEVAEIDKEQTNRTVEYQTIAQKFESLIDKYETKIRERGKTE